MLKLILSAVVLFALSSHAGATGPAVQVRTLATTAVVSPFVIAQVPVGILDLRLQIADCHRRSSLAPATRVVIDRQVVRPRVVRQRVRVLPRFRGTRVRVLVR